MTMVKTRNSTRMKIISLSSYFYLILLVTLAGSSSSSSSSSGGITIRIAVQTLQTSNIDIAGIEQLQTSLSAKYGETVQIIVEEQPSDSAAYASLIRNNYLASNYYDIYEIFSTWATEFSPGFMDLSPLSSSSASLFPDLCVPSSSSSSSSSSSCDFTSDALKAFQVNSSSTVVAVPWYLDVGALYYRTELVTDLVQKGTVSLLLSVFSPFIISFYIF
jgi:ABC-type glycerol-3-phosphate transport system substrate-binding protein